jgi:hypothetical protein
MADGWLAFRDPRSCIPRAIRTRPWGGMWNMSSIVRPHAPMSARRCWSQRARPFDPPQALRCLALFAGASCGGPVPSGPRCPPPQARLTLTAPPYAGLLDDQSARLFSLPRLPAHPRTPDRERAHVRASRPRQAGPPAPPSPRGCSWHKSTAGGAAFLLPLRAMQLSPQPHRGGTRLRVKHPTVSWLIAPRSSRQIWPAMPRLTGLTHAITGSFLGATPPTRACVRSSAVCTCASAPLLVRETRCCLGSCCILGQSRHGNDRTRLTVWPGPGLLVAFQAQTGYQRFWEARQAWGEVQKRLRSLARMVAAYVQGNEALVVPFQPRTSARPEEFPAGRHAAGCLSAGSSTPGRLIGVHDHRAQVRTMNILSAYPYILKQHLRGEFSKEEVGFAFPGPQFCMSRNSWSLQLKASFSSLQRARIRFLTARARLRSRTSSQRRTSRLSPRPPPPPPSPRPRPRCRALRGLRRRTGRCGGSGRGA